MNTTQEHNKLGVNVIRLWRIGNLWKFEFSEWRAPCECHFLATRILLSKELPLSLQTYMTRIKSYMILLTCGEFRRVVHFFLKPSATCMSYSFDILELTACELVINW
mmetsp:Transcript_12396/g.19709  ORF Transcript_12396/g.19709 Transcript_12396/m.19709 type:complete len:107 (+) Transcript_12396:1449-1769(+)